MYNYGWDSDDFIQYEEAKEKWLEDFNKLLNTKSKEKGYLTLNDFREIVGYKPIISDFGEQHIWEADWYMERHPRAIREATELYYKILNGEA